MNLANSKNREIQDSEVFNKNVETQLSEMPSQECKTRKVEENSYDEAADFEKAITATGFGKFNILLYAVSLTAGWSSMFETTTMSYVFPAAECDLKLELKHKGLLNAVTYIGMLSSALIWGFLCDTLGRKKLLVIGFLLDAVFVIMAASSQNFAMLMTAKFFGGFIINGPFAALTTYLSEFHCSQYRARVQMVLGVIFTIGNLLLPIMAVAILPLSIRLEVGENFVIHSWNIYLFMCSLSPLISFVGFMFLPETPKFLMTTGQNEKALKVFRKVYRLNTGKSEDSYPIQKLVDETQLSQNKFQKDCGQLTSKRNKTKALLDGWQQMKPLFFRPHLSKIILVCIIQCCGMMSLNTLRLWLPQLFQAVNDYEAAHSDDASASLCDMIAVFGHKNETQVIEECTVNTNNYQVYTNSMIVSGVSILGYVMAAFLINSVGKKKLLYFLGTVGGGMAMSMYFSRSVASTVAIASLFVTLGSVIVNVILAVVVDLFPTTLRTMTVSLTMMIGRSGAATGNLIFPFLLETGCAPPFFFVGAMMMAQIEVDGPADFEAACTATGYGKFNILLLLLTVPSALAVQFESTLPSYILPAAECDLNLSLNDKGFINSAAFIGMTVGGPLWGFLLDTIGRRKMLFVGSSLLFLVSVANSFTQSYTHMAICKLLGGSLSGGIYIASVTYLQEFHALRYRARIQMAVGVIYSFVNVLMPILASFFLPLNFHVTLFNLIELHSWNLFLMATSSVSLLSAISFYFLPESPKFLMSAGKPEIALEVFQRAYKFNSGKSACLYPVVKLVEEKQNYNDVTDAHKSFGGYLKNGCMQIVPLFSKKYSPRLLLACTLLPLIHMSVNTFRLWLPQIFQSIHEYQVKNNGTTSDLCTILAVFQPDEEMTDTTCNVNLENNSAVYINSMIVEFVLIAGYSMGGVLINWCGRKRLLVILGVSSTAMAVALYFSQNIPTILALAALHRTFSAVCFDIVLTIIVVLFPTALRGTAVSLSLLVSRLFTVGGNLIFPILLKSSCEGPFSGMTAVMLVASCLTFCLPNTENTNLE